jgi:hypothetical protein
VDGRDRFDRDAGFDCYFFQWDIRTSVSCTKHARRRLREWFSAVVEGGRVPTKLARIFLA